MSLTHTLTCLLAFCHPMSDVSKHFHTYAAHILTPSLTQRSQPLHTSAG